MVWSRVSHFFVQNATVLFPISIVISNVQRCSSTAAVNVLYWEKKVHTVGTTAGFTSREEAALQTRAMQAVAS